MHKIIKVVVPVLLTIALLAAVAWGIHTPDFEPAITSIALLASLIAIFADRWINSIERRKDLLRVLGHELYMNIGVLNELKDMGNVDKLSKVHIYPRFYTTSLASVIASGMFTESKDKKLWKHMNGWLQQSSAFNNRLNVSEARVLSNPEEAYIYNKKITEGKVAVGAISQFNELLDILMTKYKTESGIDYKTVLFDE